MNINIISRGKAKSAVAAAAYRAGELLKNDYDGTEHDYTRKKGIVFTEMFLPENAPDEYADRSILWNAVEKIEKAKNAQLAREVRLALPTELNLEQNINLIEDYIKNNFVYHGMVADICIHDKGDGNPHAHVMLTMRPFEKDGTWAAKSKMEYILDDNGERIKLPSGRYKVKKITATDWDSRENAEVWRKNWADFVNRHLEKHGHESRVDHRSYERQGVEQIPTIHLGAVAHGLEKRGISTERGDINRNVKKANARLKNIDRRIHDIKNPPVPQMIIDLKNSIKAQESPGYANWCKIFNLQQAAHTLIYIQENGYTDLESLQSAIQKAKAEHAVTQKQINRIKTNTKSLTAQKTQAEIYRRTMEVYKKYTAPGQLPFFKKDFYDRNKADIEAHIKARAYIFDELKLEKFPSLKKLSEEIGSLSAQEKTLQQNLRAAKKNITTLTTVDHNARMFLGYRELESNGYNPTIPANDLRFSTPYVSSFADAEKAGETETYFQSGYMDYKCAEDIYKAAFGGKNNQTAAEEILMKYSKERAESVVAAIVSNAPSDKYAEHREWASQKRNPQNGELSDRNLEIFQLHNDKSNILDSFIRKFREAADSMKSALFPFIDDKGKTDWKSGWALPREAAKPQTGSKDWDKGLSIAERMAAAERMVKEQAQNNSARKPNKKHDHDL